MDIRDSTSTSASANALLQEIDFVELYVANARQSAYYFQFGYGFTPIAYAGLETGSRDRVSFIMRQGRCHLILTAPLCSDGPLTEHIHKHGDSVKDIAFRVSDVRSVFEHAVKHGAHPIQEPTIIEDKKGQCVRAIISAFGDTTHSFVQHIGHHECFLPGYQPLQSQVAPATLFTTIDHCAISIPHGELDRWVNFYRDIFSFHPLHEEGIVTEHSAMNSKALQDPTEKINFVLVEPIPGKRRSQVEEFLKFHHGSGVQHLALHTDDIIQAIRTLQSQGISFVSTPISYYEMLPDRIGHISEDINALREVNVLVDRDEWGYLLQIFSQPIHHRPTLFIEVIQRKQARGFGSGNIHALFKALEREQEKRGNL